MTTGKKWPWNHARSGCPELNKLKKNGHFHRKQHLIVSWVVTARKLMRDAKKSKTLKIDRLRSEFFPHINRGISDTRGRKRRKITKYEPGGKGKGISSHHLSCNGWTNTAVCTIASHSDVAVSTQQWWRQRRVHRIKDWLSWSELSRPFLIHALL